MIIRDFAITVAGEARRTSATVVWEDQSYPAQALFFEIHDDGVDDTDQVDEPSADAFLTACFPLAAVHGEARLRIEGRPCRMLVDGLQTVHAWWESWRGMPGPAPAIETLPRGRSHVLTGPRRAVGFLTGGVDSLHMLMHNRRFYRRDDPAYIRDALFIHGFDIGKRARNPEEERFSRALLGLVPVAAEIGLRIIPCRTNLRHLPSVPDFWTYRHNAAGLAAVGHAATFGPAFLFIGATYDVAHPVPSGSHPAVDGLFSSQRVTVVHEGSRFSRLEKMRELASWPTGIAALRVCPADAGGQANCGRCEKCLRTRLELLVAGIEKTVTFGPSLTPIELWEEAVPGPIGDRTVFHEELLPLLKARGHDALCRFLEKKIAVYKEQVRHGVRWPAT